MHFEYMWGLPFLIENVALENTASMISFTTLNLDPFIIQSKIFVDENL